MNKNIGSKIQVLDVIEPDGALTIGTPKLTLGDWQRCCHCNQLIDWRVLCQDENGNVFVLGRTCAAAEGSVHKLTLKSKEEKAQTRALRSVIDTVEFQAWASTLPHPKGWARKTLLDDVNYWAARKPEYVREVMETFNRSRGHAAPVQSKKNTERMAALQAMADAATACVAEFTAACEKQVAANAGVRAQLRDAIAAGVTNEALLAIAELDSSNIETPTCPYSDREAVKLAQAVARNGGVVPKIPTSYELYTQLKAVAGSYKLTLV